jgi:hypothetical protein
MYAGAQLEFQGASFSMLSEQEASPFSDDNMRMNSQHKTITSRSKRIDQESPAGQKES